MIEMLSVRQTSDYLRELGMRMSPETLRRGLEQKVFPFGDAVKNEREYTYLIYRGRLERWIRDVETEGGGADA